MNKKISIHQLAEVIAVDARVTGITSQLIIKEYFEIVAQSLENGEEFTIPGIGKFVATGITDNPVVFEPDADFAKAVNAPFDMFEPQILSAPIEEIKAIDDFEEEQPEILEKEPIVEPEEKTVINLKENIVDKQENNVTEQEDIVASLEDGSAKSIDTKIDEEPDRPILTITVGEEPQLSQEPKNETVEETRQIVPPVFISLPEDSSEPDSHDEPEPPVDDETITSPPPVEEMTIYEEPISEEPSAEVDNEPDSKPRGSSRFGLGFSIGLIVGIALGALLMFVIFMISTKMISINENSADYSADNPEIELIESISDIENY